jgi:hypothetical protein
MAWIFNDIVPKMLFCRLPYGAHFLDGQGNAWQKTSGLRRRNALLKRVYTPSDAPQPPLEGFFSATAPVVALEDTYFK